MAISKTRKVIGKIHLILGLGSGLIVFIVSLTGCLYVFNSEIRNALRYDAQHITESAEHTTTIPISELWNRTQEAIGKEMKISRLTTFKDRNRSWVFSCYKGNKSKNTISYFSSIDYYKSIYVNPYSGSILKIYDEETDFFNIIKMLHWSLLLTTEVGQPIVGYATIIFVLMLITGLIMWWPKRKKQRKQRFRFIWTKKTRWRRKNYDLHSILGFYASLIMLIVALTGMVWAFKWFQGLVYVTAAGTTEMPDLRPSQSVYDGEVIMNPLDKSLNYVLQNYPTCVAFRFTPPKDSSGVIDIGIQQYHDRYAVLHNAQFDQYSGAILKERQHKDKNFGEKLITANYDIHTGSILGIPGKILAFMASLISTSLPVTGFLVWRGRKKKKRTNAVR